MSPDVLSGNKQLESRQQKQSKDNKKDPSTRGLFLLRRGEASLLGLALCAIFTGRAVQGDLERDAPLADGLPEKNVARSG